MLIIGLTGGVGSGKSTVTRYFASLGVPIIDADEVSRKLVVKGSEAYQPIIRRFGTQILDSKGEIDRRRLRDIIFSDSRERVALEAILHPLIREQLKREIAALDAPYCLVAIPLLIETGQTDLVDRILVVDSPLEQQIERTVQRDDVDGKNVEAIIAAQVDANTRKSLADDILSNDSDKSALYKQIDELHQKYLQMANSEALEAKSDIMNNNLKISSVENSEAQQIPDMPWLKTSQNVNTASPQESSALKDIVYELPLNEKMRTLIRLESLFEEIEHYLNGSTVWDSRAAVNAFIAVTNVLCRPELKTDLMKELDRINSTLSKYATMEGVNTSRLQNLQGDLASTVKQLRSLEGQLGQGLKQNEFVMSLRQRESIPGGALAMDMPGYAHWLSKPFDERCVDIRSWLSEFSLVKKSAYLILQLIRDSAVASRAVAKTGFYQHNLDTGIANQIVRVILPQGAKYFPEISGGKHRFTVRFLKPMGFDRPIQVEEDVTFKLICCAL